jgi:hypothetical protein
VDMRSEVNPRWEESAALFTLDCGMRSHGETVRATRSGSCLRSKPRIDIESLTIVS